MDKKHRLKTLFRKYVSDQINQRQFDELIGHFGKADDSDLKQLVEKELEQEHHIENAEVRRIVENLDRKMAAKFRPPVFFFRSWRAAAAIVTGLMLAGLSWYYIHLYSPPDGRAAAGTELVMQPGDIAPGSSKAMLILEGGQQIELNPGGKGIVVEPQRFLYKDGTTVDIPGVSAGESIHPGHAVLVTPPGGQYQVVLPDGTRVWLNAASSLRYPVAFAGDTREVELEGEGYFEVAKNPDMPFIVKSRGQRVRVLGTTFNINAYDNERVIATTLIEGSVEISSDKSPDQIHLKPGQQVVVSGNRMTVRTVNTRDFTGWREGKFIFNRTELSAILRQIERWYNVSFDTGTVPTDVKLWGTLSRQVMLSEILAVLELNTNIKFTREGRRIIMSD